MGGNSTAWDARCLQVKSEVREALDDNAPVVALESSVIAHGLPRPQNLEIAQHLQDLVREEGATPATVAVLKGQIRIGLHPEELVHLATAQGVRKVSPRQLPLVVAEGLDAATTVAGTLHVAHRVGIEVLATGGIGGVHRQHPFDISADLPELARTPMAVVCSGAKAILDIPRTLEWLETHGVPILGYGCDRFPAFYSRDSGLPVDTRVDSPEKAAHIIQIKRELAPIGGVLVVAPVPTRAAVASSVVEEAVRDALAEAEEKAITGQALTPFLLRRVSELTKGTTMRANVALLNKNAVIAALLARALRA